MTRPGPIPEFDSLPDMLPVFPLDGVLLLPGGQLPLNIFEPRYLAMVQEALKTDRLIGMVQSRGATHDLYTTGCAGKIVAFTETEDGRFLITLKGLCRFQIIREYPMHLNGFRRVQPSWSPFRADLDPVGELNIDREKLCALLQSYFSMEGMSCDWSMIDEASDDRLITCLSMACPLDAGEKQALLEAACARTRADLFMTLLEMAIRDPSRHRPVMQ
jgi:Lon protease-like protein